MDIFTREGFLHDIIVEQIGKAAHTYLCTVKAEKKPERLYI